MKIILDRKALELLFENDPELQVEFKNASVNYAAKHFLKEIAPGTIQAAMRKEAKSIMKEAVGEMVRKKNVGWMSAVSAESFVPAVKITQKIERECNISADAKIREIIKSLNIPKMIADVVDAQTIKMITYNIERGVEKKLNRITHELSDEQG